MKVTLVYDNIKDKEFLDLTNLKIPFFIDYLNMNNLEGRKSGFKVLNYWSAKKLPFIVVEEDNSKPKVFYSEIGELATNQFIKWLNGRNII